MAEKKESYEAKTKIGATLDFAATEAYNLLRANIGFSILKEPGEARLFGVTSSVPQEGKSYTSINIAYAFAKSGSKVLLIDGDMRRPSIAKTLGVSGAEGLSDYLIGTTEDVFKVGMLHENLTVCFAGSIPPNPSELIGSVQMQEMLEKMKGIYDYIIIDLPPVNSVSDPLVVGRMLDGICLVIRHGYSRKKEITEAIRQIRFANVRMLGIVYNSYMHAGGHYYKKHKNGKYYYNKKHYYTSK